MRRGPAALCAVLACAGLAAGYLAGRQAAPAVALFILGVLWLAAQLCGWTWASSLGLLAASGASAAGLLQGLGPAWMLGGAMAGLLAWDLAGLEHHLSLASPEDNISLIARRHVAWLALAAGLGLALAAAAALIHLRVPLGWTIVLALVSVLGVARLLSFLRRY